MDTSPIAARLTSSDPAEITINFGVVAGRQAARDEIDRLAEALRREVGAVTITVQTRYDYAADQTGVSAYEIVVAFPPYVIPDEEPNRGLMLERFVEISSLWALDCSLSDAPMGESLNERLIRE